MTHQLKPPSSLLPDLRPHRPRGHCDKRELDLDHAITERNAHKTAEPVKQFHSIYLQSNRSDQFSLTLVARVADETGAFRRFVSLPSV